MLSTLRPYQKDARKQILATFQNDKGFMLGDEMGLGKTVQSLAVAEQLPKRHGRVGVVAPAGLVGKWKDEILKHLGAKRDFPFSVASYNELSKPQNLHFFTRQPFDLVIFDEAHYVKDFDAQRTRACLGAPADKHRTVASVADKMLGLSGTWPANRVGETYPWLYHTGHPLTKNLTYEKFLYRYAGKVETTNYGLTHKGVKNDDEFRALLGRNFLRRTIDDVEKDIPKGTLDTVEIEVSEKTYKEEKELLRELMVLAGHAGVNLRMIENDPEFLTLLLDSVPDFPRMAEFRHRQGLAKVKPVFDFLENSVLPELSKFILFTYHTDVAETYAKKLRAKGANVVLVHGKNTDKASRYEILKKADKEKDCVLIATLDSVREGFDLIGFTHSFYAELDFRTYVMEQTQGRTRRIGQSRPVFWTLFHYPEGVEALIARRLKEKAADIEKIRGK